MVRRHGFNLGDAWFSAYWLINPLECFSAYRGSQSGNCGAEVTHFGLVPHVKRRIHTTGFSQGQAMAVRLHSYLDTRICSNLEPSLSQIKHRIAVLNWFLSLLQLSDTCPSKVSERWHWSTDRENRDPWLLVWMGTGSLGRTSYPGSCSWPVFLVLKSVVWTCYYWLIFCQVLSVKFPFRWLNEEQIISVCLIDGAISVRVDSRFGSYRCFFT